MLLSFFLTCYYNSGKHTQWAATDFCLSLKTNKRLCNRQKTLNKESTYKQLTEACDPTQQSSEASAGNLLGQRAFGLNHSRIPSVCQERGILSRLT